MNNIFVSDISSVLLNFYNNKEYEEIYDAIDASITADLSEDTDSAYRLQQDIAVLNTTLLTDISKYVNSNTPSIDVKDTTKQDTFKQQSESTKEILSYKYLYLIMKMIVILTLLGFLYMKLFVSSDNLKNQSLSNTPFFTRA